VGPASSSSGAADVTGEANETAPASAANPPSVTTSPVPEREARVLDAVRALGQATASEVADRTGQPNGSVVVALRALVARGVVARTKSGRGVEYSLVSFDDTRAEALAQAVRSGELTTATAAS
jgi:predicted transcriptional regulator